LISRYSLSINCLFLTPETCKLDSPGFTNAGKVKMMNEQVLQGKSSYQEGGSIQSARDTITKKALLKSEELCISMHFYQAKSDLSVPVRDGIGTLPIAYKLLQVVKASLGHVPPPFLIRDTKELGQR
jgi:hypothetical protein